MPRSSYVYVVMQDEQPLVGFTVKHELVSWLKRPGRETSWYSVMRLSDGVCAAPESLDVGALVA